jgi:phage terminase small subunit
MKLTPKQEMFCREYLVDLNGTQAAIRAGYSEKTANEQSAQLLAKLSIKEYVQSLMDERKERVDITADYVLQGIKDLTERCIQAQPVIVDGAPTGEYKFEAGAALKGYELMGKHLKLFTDKTEVTGKNGGAIEQSLTVKYVGNSNPEGV